MGIKGYVGFVPYNRLSTNIRSIYRELGQGKRVSLSKLASDSFVTDGRPLRLAIDIAIWQFQTQAAQGMRHLYDFKPISKLSQAEPIPPLGPSSTDSPASFDPPSSQYLFSMVPRNRRSSEISGLAVEMALQMRKRNNSFDSLDLPFMMRLEKPRLNAPSCNDMASLTPF